MPWVQLYVLPVAKLWLHAHRHTEHIFLLSSWFSTDPFARQPGPCCDPHPPPASERLRSGNLIPVHGLQGASSWLDGRVAQRHPCLDAQEPRHTLEAERVLVAIHGNLNGPLLPSRFPGKTDFR